MKQSLWFFRYPRNQMSDAPKKLTHQLILNPNNNAAAVTVTRHSGNSGNMYQAAQHQQSQMAQMRRTLASPSSTDLDASMATNASSSQATTTSNRSATLTANQTMTSSSSPSASTNNTTDPDLSLTTADADINTSQAATSTSLSTAISTGTQLKIMPQPQYLPTRQVVRRIRPNSTNGSTSGGNGNEIESLIIENVNSDDENRGDYANVNPHLNRRSLMEPLKSNQVLHFMLKSNFYLFFTVYYDIK